MKGGRFETNVGLLADPSLSTPIRSSFFEIYIPKNVVLNGTALHASFCSFQSHLSTLIRCLSVLILKYILPSSSSPLFFARSSQLTFLIVVPTPHDHSHRHLSNSVVSLSLIIMPAALFPSNRQVEKGTSRALRDMQVLAKYDMIAPSVFVAESGAF